MLRVEVKGLRVYAWHGVLEQERRVGNEFAVDVRLDVTGAERALTADSLEDTVNYADVVEIVRREMAIPSKLLEHVCERIRKALCREFGQKVSAGEVTISKLAPPIPAQLDRVSVTLTW